MLFQTKYLKCAAKIKETREIWALSAIIPTSGWAAGFHTFTEFPHDWHTCSPGCITSSTDLKIDTEIRPVVLFVDVWQHDCFKHCHYNNGSKNKQTFQTIIFLCFGSFCSSFGYTVETIWNCSVSCFIYIPQTWKTTDLRAWSLMIPFMNMWEQITKENQMSYGCLLNANTVRQMNPEVLRQNFLPVIPA